MRDPSQRRAATFRRHLHPVVFIVASLAAAATLMAILAVPQWLSKQARWEVLRLHVGEIGRLAAGAVDGDLHRQLLDPANYSDDLYARALTPLVRLHSSDPDIHYLYTMFEKDGISYFVLDTAASPDLRTSRQLRASAYMERFDLREEYKDAWLQQLAAGKTYVTPTFEQDDYGYFLTAHAPIYDSKGRYSGFVGVDFDMEYYLNREASFRVIAIGSLVAALILALAIGYFVALYYSAMSHRMQELHAISIRDSLTGMLNRRGAMEVIKKALELHAGKSALLLVDIDNLKLINDMRGHVTGDAVIACASAAIRECLREGDECARMGDGFLVFALDCNAEGATEMAQQILARLSDRGLPLVGAKFSVSIGIAVHDSFGADFAQMHRDADAALQQARAEGRNRIGLFASSEAEIQPDRPPAVTVDASKEPVGNEPH